MRRHSWVNETGLYTAPSSPPQHPPPPPRGLPSAPGKMDLKRGQLPPSLLPPLNEQMEASATIITTLPGSLLTNRNNTGGANKPQSNMTPPLMLLTSLSLQGRTSRTDSFLSNGPATAAISTSGGGGGEFAEVISFPRPRRRLGVRSWSH